MDENWTRKIGAMHDYGSLAASYDAQYEKEQIEKVEVALSSINLNSNDVILDAGCGTGVLTQKLAKPVKLIVGLDSSKQMLTRAKARLHQFLNIMLVHADADFLPIREKTFTHVFAITLLQNMPNPKVTLRELMRVIENDGIIVFTGLKKSFTLAHFKTLMKDSDLKQLSLVNKKEVKDYVAVCKLLNAT